MTRHNAADFVQATAVVVDAARKWEAHLAHQAEIREALGIDYDAPLTLTWSEGAKEPAG